MAENVLKNRNYFLLFLGSLVSNMGTHIYNFAVSLYILKLTGSASFQGLYLMVGGLVYFSLSIFGGAIVDRLDKVKILYITDFINGVVILSAGFIMFGDVSYEMTILILFATTIILGVNLALFNPAVRSLPPYLLDDDQLQQSSSITSGMFAVYTILGVVLGGILFDTVSIEYIFVINGISFIFSSISERFIKVNTKPDIPQAITFKGVLIDIKDGMGYVYKMKPIFYIILISAVLNFFTIPMISNGLPYLFTIQLDRGAVYLSLIRAMFPVGIIVSSLILGSQSQKDKLSPLIVMGLFGMGVMIYLMLFGLELYLANLVNFTVFIIVSMSTFAIAGYFNGYLNIPFGVAIMKYTDKDKLGRVYSVRSVVVNGLTPISMGLAGVVIENFGVMVIFYSGATIILVTAFLTRINKHIQHL